MKILTLWLNLTLLVMFIFLNSCGIYKPVDAKEFPPEPEKRVQRNIEEGRGMKLFKRNKGGVFDFASSNPLWRASLDTIDFMPLLSANYSGGIIITDWYSDNSDDSESLKVTIRFLTSEVRSDALDIKIFRKNCNAEKNCSISEEEGDLVLEIKKSILKKAALYKKEKIDKNRKPYELGGDGVSGGTSIF